VAEGARLESVYTGNRIEGSNPPLSASSFIVLYFALASILQSIPLFELDEAGMALSPVPKVNVNLTKYVNLGENQWRFCPVVIAGNGRVKSDYVLAAGRRSFIAKAPTTSSGTKTFPPSALRWEKRDRSTRPTATPHPNYTSHALDFAASLARPWSLVGRRSAVLISFRIGSRF
jgi:hypothetical protein